jgi:hypothetical protein
MLFFKNKRIRFSLFSERVSTLADEYKSNHYVARIEYDPINKFTFSAYIAGVGWTGQNNSVQNCLDALVKMKEAEKTSKLQEVTI